MTAPPSFRNPFTDLLQIEEISIAGGTARMAVEHRPDFSNMHGAVHGGVLMALIDTTMARAAMSRQEFRLSVVSTGVSVNFMSPSFGRVVADARVIGGGKSVCFCEAEVRDGHGHLVAKGMGTFKYRKPPEGARAAQPPEIIE